MLETTFTELRKQTESLFDAVENGDVVRVYREGKPIADIVPVPKVTPSWKREVPRLTIKGFSLTQEILKDRLGTE
ncbi:MAG: prevent-host-death protein [Pseudomonadota bacterium]